MVIIVIRRFVRPDKEVEFLESYRKQKPIENPAFCGETLTKISEDRQLPDGLISLKIGGQNCVTYLNIAKWKSWQDFSEQFDVTGEAFDDKIETAPRQRVVLDIIPQADSDYH